MRAAVMARLGSPLGVVDLPDPTPAENEVVLRVGHCGICGSDLHLHETFELPGLVLGHEFAGEVVAVGIGVDGWTVGTLAAGLSLASCGHCHECRSGRVRKCATVAMLGVERPGAYAEYVALPAHDVFALPANLTTALGALVEPLAVARHAVERAGGVEGRHTLVVGAGPVGLAVALWLPLFGAASVTVSDPAEGRRQMALALGVDAVADPTAGRPLVGADGTPPSVVFECVGLPGLIEGSAAACAVDGRVVVVGVCMGPDTIIPMTAMAKELDLSFAFYYRRQDFEATIGALDDGSLAGDRLITGHVGLDDLPGRFDALKTAKEDVKVLLTP